MPGILLTATLMVSAWLVARRNGYEPDLSEPPTFRQLAVSFRDSIWALAFPVILIVGFRFGFFTATEAGAFLVFYALFIGFFVYRELTLEKLYEAIRGTVSDLGMVMLLIMMAAVLGFAVTIEQGPQRIAALVTTLTQEPLFILILVLALLLISGMFLEGAANILLVTPIVLPVLVQAGYDPVHMGILMVTLINIGGLTPPVGVIMFTVCGILDVKIGEFSLASVPYFLALLVFLAILVAFPGLSLFLPGRLI